MFVLILGGNSRLSDHTKYRELETRGVHSLIHSVSHCHTEDETQLDPGMSVYSLPSAAGKPELQTSGDDIQNQAGPLQQRIMFVAV